MPLMAAKTQTHTLRINEIFHSVQGESSWAGLECVFVRMAGCHLRCSYCDTEYAFTEGTRRPVDEVLAEVLAFGSPLVELTGGEPLLQTDTFILERLLLDAGLHVLIETSGACDISPCDPRSTIIMDIKTPSSGEAGRTDVENFARLRSHDEVKFVIGTREDYAFACATIQEHNLIERVACVLFSPVHEQPKGLHISGQTGLEPRELVKWMLEDHVAARLQLQIHKFIWPPSTRGV